LPEGRGSHLEPFHAFDVLHEFPALLRLTPSEMGTESVSPI
jgi:hypothetical protein